MRLDVPCLDHSTALVSDVLEGGRDVDLLAALRHPVQDHVDEDVGAGTTDAVAEEKKSGSDHFQVLLLHACGALRSANKVILFLSAAISQRPRNYSPCL